MKLRNWLQNLTAYGTINVKSSESLPETEEQKALKVLQDAEARDIQACTEEINAVLKKYGRTISVLNQINLVRVQ